VRLSLFRASVASFALLASASAFAADISLAWDPSPSSGVTGYILKYGTTPGVYSNSVDVGNRTAFTVSNLAIGVRYFFAVQAYAGATSTTSPLSQEVSWAIPIATNDFDRNGRMDLVWQQDVTRQAVVWFNDNRAFGTVTQRYSPVTSTIDVTGWSLAASSDFNGDGVIDLVWQHDVTRRAMVWYMGGASGTQMMSSGWLSAVDVLGWKIVAARDFNGDGRPDLVWQNDESRQALAWFMGGPAGDRYDGWAWLAATSAAVGWRIVGAADLNFDGYNDIVWQHDDSRQVLVWYIGGLGTTVMGWAWLSANAVPGWRVVGVGDLNGDRAADLVWLNDADRTAAVWYMGGPQGATVQGYGMLTTYSVAGWTLSLR
jgi:hypothetical protein